MPISAEEVRAIARRFVAECTEPTPFGDGHINDTYRFLSDVDGVPTRVVLQRINRTAFPHPEWVMDNMCRITKYLREQIARAGGDPVRETIALLCTDGGDWYVTDSQNDVWRAYRFVENAVSYDQTGDTGIFRAAGEAFGRFCRLLGGFDASTLHETIVDFHCTPKRFAALMDAVQADKAHRAASVAEEIAFCKEREGFADALIAAHDRGELPLRVTHNDTKLNNVLIDEQTGRGLCVIDLDTVMPGLPAYDFGDAIRFGANTAAEDERDLRLVRFSLPMYRAYADGYLDTIGDTLTSAELASLPVGARMMTFECGMRFLTDYLNGDTYFKTAYPEHNLVRARNQFALLRDMERHEDDMRLG